MMWLLSSVILILMVVLTTGSNTAVASENNAACGFEVTNLMHRVVKHIHEFDFQPGGQYLAGVTFQNHCESTTPIVGFIEVRDSTGITLAVETKMDSWVNGTGGLFSHLGMYWVPEAPGRYEIRAFAVSNSTAPEVLTEVASKLVDIPATKV
jgi:hypothetical protein